MKYKTILSFIVLCLALTSITASPIGKLKLDEQLVKLVSKYYPKARIAQDNGNLSVKYNTMIFTIHRQWKTGEILKKTYQIEGPNFKGFMLSIYIKKGEYEGQAIIPQTLHERYWHTYIDRPPTEDGKGHYVINFSYGLRLNKDFTRAIFKALPKSRLSKK